MNGGAYQLAEVLGEGGSARIWGLVDGAGRPVRDRVVKVFQRGPLADELQRELDAYARLHHPNVLMLIDHGLAPSDRVVGLPDGSAFLVLERAEGALDRREILGWGAAREVLEALLRALAHAHAHGVVHLDLKPSNVVRAGGRWKLADFGVARAFRKAGSDERSVVGTPGYMAPEQWTGALVATGPWSDLFALGVLGWELVTGHRLYRGSPQQIARATQSGSLAPFEPRFELPRGVVGWLQRLLAAHPMARYRHAADALFALRGFGAAAGTAAPVGPASPPGVTISAKEEAVVAPRLAAPAGPTLAILPDRDPGPPQPERLPMPELSDLAPPGALPHRIRLGELPLMGRRAELESLWARLSEVRRARRSIVCLLRGPSGVGASALARGFAARCAERGAATVLRARHQPNAFGVDAVASAVLAHLRLDREDPWKLAPKLAPVLDAHGFEEPHERDAFGGALATVLGADMGGAVPDREAVIEHFLRRCSARPVLLLLDDLQWGSATLDTLEALVRARGLSLLVLATVQQEALAAARPLEAARLTAPGPFRELAVRPLNAGAMRSWLAQLFELEGPALEAMVAQSAGLPLRALTAGVWGAACDGPLELETLWLEQAAAGCGDPGSRLALDAAAALGLEVVSDEHEAVMERLGVTMAPGVVGRLAHRMLVRSDRVGWHFAHPDVRAALLRRAEREGRGAHLHRACAGALESLYPSPPFGILERRARHERAAGRPERARELFHQAARRALDVEAPGQAERLLAELASAGSSEPPDVRLTRSRGLRELGRVAEARRILDALLAEPGPSLHALHERARVAILARESTAEALVARVRAALPRVDESRLRGELLEDLGLHAMHRRRLREAADSFRAAAEAFAESDDRRGEGSARLSLAVALQRQGNLTGAREAIDASELAYQRAGSRSGVARVAYVRADLARIEGDLDEAERSVRRGLRFVRRPADRALLELTEALVALDRGAPEEAASALAEGRVRAERLGMEGLAACARLYEAVAAAAAGRWSAADEALADTKRRLAKRPHRHPSLVVYGERLGELARAADQGALARAAAELVAAQRAAARPDVVRPGARNPEGPLRRDP